MKDACEKLDGNADAKPSVAKKAFSAIVELYEEWDKDEPGAGHATLAAQWQKRMPPEQWTR